MTTLAQYHQLYAFGMEGLMIHKIAERRRRCAQVMLEYSFKIGRAVAVVPSLQEFAARAGIHDKSHTKKALDWLDLAGIARCYTDRGVYLFKPDYRQWDHRLVPLVWTPEAWHKIHEELLLIPDDPTLDEALAAVSRQAVLQSLAVAGAATPVDGASTEKTARVGRAAGLPVAGAATLSVATPATISQLAGPFAVADPATAIVNNSLARAEEEPENRKNRETVEPVSGEILEPVAVAQPATLPPWTLLDDVLRRIAKLCGSREIAPWNPVTRRGGNRQRWIKAFREHRQHLILALEDAELQKPYGFRTSAGAYLNKRFNDRVAGRAPRWQRPNQQEIRP